MIKTVIVEDDPSHCKTLEMMLAEVNAGIEVVATCTNSSDAVAAIEEYKPELVFLDIELEGDKTGFDVIKECRQPDFSVIFTTQYTTANNAINAIRLSALDFLPKPLLQSELLSAVNHFIEDKRVSIERLRTLKMNLEIERSNAKVIWIGDGEKSLRVNSDNILYAQSDNTTTFFFLASEIHGRRKITSTISIGQWEEVLERYGFCRIHNRCLVNLEYVVEYARLDSTVKMRNDEVLSVSRQRKDHLLKRLGLTKFS
jgi:two-component system LytT family response regulator